MTGDEWLDMCLAAPEARKPRLLKETVMSTKMNVVRVLGIAIVTSTLLSVMGCNTMEGAGKDTQKAGEKIENAADRNK